MLSTYYSSIFFFCFCKYLDCGRTELLAQAPIQRETAPWHVAIHEKPYLKSGVLKWKCDGTLISLNIVVSGSYTFIHIP